MNHARNAYSMVEDKKILRYILNSNYQDSYKGDTLWKKMEEEKVCGIRTWQSMKNRFVKSILPDCRNPIYGLTNEEKEILTKLDKKKSITATKRNFDNRLVRKCIDDRRQDKEDSLEESPNGELTYMPYSTEEDKLIINFLLNQEKIDGPYGYVSWKLLEINNVCPGRTWQSMKNRFLRYIYPALSCSAYGLSKDDISWFKTNIDHKPSIITRQNSKTKNCSHNTSTSNDCGSDRPSTSSMVMNPFAALTPKTPQTALPKIGGVKQIGSTEKEQSAKSSPSTSNGLKRKSQQENIPLHNESELRSKNKREVANFRSSASSSKPKGQNLNNVDLEKYYSLEISWTDSDSE